MIWLCVGKVLGTLEILVPIKTWHLILSFWLSFGFYFYFYFYFLISSGNVKMLTNGGISSNSSSNSGGPLSLGPLIFGSSSEECNTAQDCPTAPIHQRRKP